MPFSLSESYDAILKAVSVTQTNETDELTNLCSFLTVLMKLHKQAVRSIPVSFEQFTVSDDKNATGNTLTYARSKLSET